MMMIMALSVSTVHADDVLDLTGYWTTEINDGSGMMALTDGDEAVVVWDIDDELYIYWAGSYIAPEEDTNEYTWTSIRDADQTDMEWFASTEDTKVLRKTRFLLQK